LATEIARACYTDDDDDDAEAAERVTDDVERHHGNRRRWRAEDERQAALILNPESLIITTQLYGPKIHRGSETGTILFFRP